MVGLMFWRKLDEMKNNVTVAIDANMNNCRITNSQRLMDSRVLSVLTVLGFYTRGPVPKAAYPFFKQIV